MWWMAMALASDPIPFLRGAPSSAPVEPGSGSVELAGGAAVPFLGFGGGGDLSATVAVSRRVTIFGHAQVGAWVPSSSSGPLTWGEERVGTGGLAVRADLVSTDRVRAGVWTRLSYGHPLGVEGGLPPGFEPSLGLSAHFQATPSWTLDASVSVFTVPLAPGALSTERDVFGRSELPFDLLYTSLDRSLADLRVASTWHRRDGSAWRLAFEPLPTLSYRRRFGPVVIEPAVAFGYAGLKVEGRW